MSTRKEAPAAPMADDQAAELAALEAAAAMSAEQLAGGAGEPAAAQAPDLGDEIAGILMAVATVLAPALPSLKTLYTPETTGAAGAALAALCRKHGWLDGGLMGEYAEEVTAAMVCGPLAVATWQGVKADMAALKAKHASAQSLPGAVPPGLTPEPEKAEEPPVATVKLERG